MTEKEDIKSELRRLQNLRTEMLECLQKEPNLERVKAVQEEFNEAMTEEFNNLHQTRGLMDENVKCECKACEEEGDETGALEEEEKTYSLEDFLIDLDFSSYNEEEIKTEGLESLSQLEKNQLEVARQDALLKKYTEELLIIE
jgi:hypothetical protein